MPSNADPTPDEPPVYGEIEITLPLAPVSQQASKQARDTLVEEVRKFTRPLKYLLTGDVTVDVFWHLLGDLRYESDTAPDIENIQKPLLDGLCGPDGILIDDCQISAFGSEWVSWTRIDQQVTIRIKYAPDDWMQKPIRFVQIEKALCLPMEDGLTNDQAQWLAEAYLKGIDNRDKLLSFGVSSYYARVMLPVHRVYHRTRIHGFKVVDIPTLVSEVKQK